MGVCKTHGKFSGMVCAQCAMAQRQQMIGRQQQAAAQVLQQTVTNLPGGATLALQARVGMGTFAAVNTGADLFIPLGTSVEFKAAATGAAVPVDFASAAWSGSSGASGTGATKTVLFNAASAAKNSRKAVTVSFSGQTATVQCVVYTLTPAVTFVDNIGGAHSANELGVDERITLGFQTTPVGVTAAEAGGLKWSVAGLTGRKNDGIIQEAADKTSAPLENGTGHYIAPYVTGDPAKPLPASKNVQIRLSVCNGPIKGCGIDKTFRVYLPIAHMKMMANTEKHLQNYASAGFQGEIFLFPRTVSFRTLRWREAGGRPVHTGTFSAQSWANATHKPTTFEGQAATDMPVDAGNSATGCKILQVDSVFSGAIAYTAPASANDNTVVGTYVWPIYWQYRPGDLGGAEPYIRFQIAHHVATMFQTGRMLMYKGHDPAVNCTECTARSNRQLTAATATPF